MSLARVKTWISGEILTAQDLNGEFNNILQNPTSLISPFTANLNANSKQITNLALENLGASPAAGTQGRIFFNTSTGLIGFDDGVAIHYIVISTQSFGEVRPVNLLIKNNATTTSKVDISAERVFIGPQRVDNFSVTAASSVTGINGLDAGALASTQLYYVWGLWNTVTSSAGSLLSLSETAPTLPASSGYSTGYQKLLGAIPTSTATAFYLTRQVGERAFFDVPVVISTNLTSTSVTQLSLAGQVPATNVRGVWMGTSIPLGPDILHMHYTSSWSVATSEGIVKIGTQTTAANGVSVELAPFYLPTYNATRSNIFYAKETTNQAALLLDGFEMEFRV